MELFAVTAPGLEQLCAAELAGLGIAAEPEPGGAGWRGDVRTLYRANLECRTASRVLARAGGFRARTFHELERHTARLPWRTFVPEGVAVALRITARKSKLYHEGAIAERIVGVLHDNFGLHVSGAARTDDDGDAATLNEDAQLVVVRFLRDVCTVSIDGSGALLHQRGYRQALAKAPLRETMAAALLRASGWTGDTPLLDPMCGSGTIAIEAALVARRIAPGLANAELLPRAYACLRWPSHDESVWSDVVQSARAAVLPAAGVTIRGTDRHGGAIAASSANAQRAGVQADVTFERRALSAIDVPAQPGHLVTNPPYGVRVGDRRELHALYAALGRVAAERLPGWTVAFLAADDRLAAATGLPLHDRLATRNGGIAVRLLVARIPH